MSKRKAANRAEAIVRGVGALTLLLLLFIVLRVLPKILKGKDAHEMMNSTIDIIMGFALLAGVVVLIGLFVWLRVLKGKRKGSDSEQSVGYR
jgi:hypothetical protein